MFAYALSAAVAFMFFGVVYNLLRNFKPYWFDEYYTFHWACISVAAILWGVTIPILIIIFVTYTLKILVDKISQFILKRVKK